MSGIFGVVSKKNCRDDFFYLGDYHSHLGTEFAGIATSGRQLSRKIHDIRHSQFKTKLYDDFKNLRTHQAIGAIGHEEQPIYVKSKFGNFCIVANGWIDNWSDLAKDLFSKGYSFSEVANGRVNICELVSKLIIQKDTLLKGIEYMFSCIDGSISLLILNKDGVYAARDKLGISPLIVGKKKNTWAVVTETASFPNLGFETFKYLWPGEVVCIDKHGVRSQGKRRQPLKICAFLWIYTGFPASSYEGINVEIVRERCGKFLAKGDTAGCNLVCGVPDSGGSGCKR